MKQTKRHVVQLGPPVNRTFHLDYAIDAHALLWASAKGREFIPAIATIGSRTYQNGPLHRKPLPDAVRFPVLHDRIGYWETVIEIEDPEVLIWAAVQSALNGYREQITGNPLAAEPARLAATITEAAREWAEKSNS